MGARLGTDQLAEVLAIIEAGRVISYGDNTDKEFPEITWSLYGLVDTNEIAVVVNRAGTPYAAARAEAGLIHPAMIDRRWGIDVADHEVAMELSEMLWDKYSAELKSAVGK